VTPDISVFAKALASGYPISVVAGARPWMELIEASRVIHAGTMNSGNATVAAALATLEVLESTNPYDRLHAYGHKLMEGLRSAAREHGQDLLVQGPGPMFNTAFTPLGKVTDYRDTLSFDRAKMRQFMAGMHDKGIRIIGRGLWYISAAHTAEDIDQAIETASEVLAAL
jgi:glutamate-1-semialdehyde 2,1-aminomutase